MRRYLPADLLFPSCPFSSAATKKKEGFPENWRPCLSYDSFFVVNLGLKSSQADEYILSERRGALLPPPPAPTDLRFYGPVLND